MNPSEIGFNPAIRVFNQDGNGRIASLKNGRRYRFHMVLAFLHA